MKREGKIWKFAHNVDTDVITPGKYLQLEIKELAKHALEVLDPEFPKQAKPGDLVVAGRNFGCGSSREHAPRVLKELGIGCVIAETFARIFYRNAIAIGLPIAVVPGLWAETEAGDVVSVDLSQGEAVNQRTGKRYQVRQMPERLLKVIEDGGIVPALKRIGAEQAAADAARSGA